MAPFEVLLVGPAPTEDRVRAAFPEEAVATSTAEGVADAKERIEEDPPEAVVTDHTLEDGTGLDLLVWIREVFPGLPVVLYADVGDERVAGDAVAADVSEYVPRTSSDPALEDVVDRTIECARRRYLADEDNGNPVETALQLKERAMDEAPVGIVISDPSLPDNPMIYVNDSFGRITGYDQVESIGRNCRFLQGEESDEGAIETMRHAVDDRRRASVELVNYTKEGKPFWNQVEIAPLLDDDGEVEYFVGFQSDVTDRKEAELRAERRAEELRAERRSLERLLTRIDGILEEVTEVAMTARSRDEIERRACEALVENGDYAGAWIGRREMTTDRIVPSATAGCGQLGDVEVSVGPEEDGPVATARSSGSVAVESVDELPAESSHQRLAGHGAGVAAVSLSYRETEYGVLVVYADRAETLDGEERAVIGSLGNVLATGINAVENQRLLAADEYLQLDFDVRPPGPFFVELSRRLGCAMTYNGSVVDPDGSLSASFVLERAAPEAVRDAAADLGCVDDATVVAEYDDACLAEFDLPEGSFVRTVVDHNGSVGTIEVEDGVGEVEIELPQASNPGQVVESLTDPHDGMTLVAQHRRERTRRTRREFVESLREDLTDQQLTAIQTAYLRDYFEWSRPVSGDELAESMDISRSTYHQHLRAAQRKLVGAFLRE